MSFKEVVEVKGFWKSVIILGFAFMLIYNAIDLLFSYGFSFDEFIAEKEVTVEGANASEIVNRVALEKGLEMPIIKMTYKVVHQNYNPVDAIREFMSRNPSKERN